jgi:hypothetical protein
VPATAKTVLFIVEMAPNDSGGFASIVNCPWPTFFHHTMVIRRNFIHNMVIDPFCDFLHKVFWVPDFLLLPLKRKICKVLFPIAISSR